MSKLSRDDVLKLARLARLTIADEEIEQYQKELNEILNFVEQLQNVDVSRLESTSQVTGLTNVMRADEAHDYGYTSADLLRNIPTVEADQIKAKRMIE